MAFNTIKDWLTRGTIKTLQNQIQTQSVKLQELETFSAKNLARYNNIYNILSDRPFVTGYSGTVDYVTAYNTNDAVRAIVDKCARKFSSIPCYLLDNEGNKIKGVAKDLEKLLDRPNKAKGWATFKSEMYGWYKLSGEVFIRLNRGMQPGEAFEVPNERIRRMPVFEMVVLETDKMKIIESEDDYNDISHYEYSIKGKIVRFAPSEILHIRNASIGACGNDRFRGISPLVAASRTLSTHNSATNSLVRSYNGDGARGFITRKPDEFEMTPEQVQDVKHIIDYQANDQINKNQVRFLNGEYDYKEIGASPVDLQTIEGKENAKKDLCAIFDLPYELFQSDTTFANKTEAQRGWVVNAIYPDCQLFDDEFNRVLLPAFGLENKMKIQSDIQELQEFKKDSVTAEPLSARSWLTPNEKRIAEGFEPTTNPFDDERWIDSPQGSVPYSVFVEQLAASQIESQMLGATQALMNQGLIPGKENE